MLAFLQVLYQQTGHLVSFSALPFTSSALAVGLSSLLSTISLAATTLEEVVIIGVAPGSSLGQKAERFPFAVKSTNFVQLESRQSLDLTEFMNSELGSVSINSAQNNPLQADLQFRGFTASPLLGLPQGIAVYQDGVRMNEPLGDAVNWDLLPESAVYSMDLISGANPVFGLNTLGGALSINMKNGFNFSDSQIEVQKGSWGRTIVNLESGNNFSLHNGSQWGYYVNASLFKEDGWRDLSASEAQNFFGSLSWRNAEISALDLSYQLGDSELIGNGALPIGMLAIDRSAVFTAPDITENDLQAITLKGSHFITDTLQLSGNLFWRDNNTHSFNGDGSEFELCEFSGGAQALFEETDDIEDALEDALDIELDEICAGEDDDINNFADLESLIAQAALSAGLQPDDFAIDNVTAELYGTGILSGDAINNISQRRQQSRGFTFQGTLLNPLFDRPNQFLAGTSYFDGKADFSSVTELSLLDPLTRSTQGLGTGTFYAPAETHVSTATKTVSVYFVDTLDLTDKLSIMLAGRYNDSDITLRDQSGEREELNGDHNFKRFNPSVGLTYNYSENTNFYGSISESNRVPTPIELACNEGVFGLAREYALAAGEDPDDIDFECRLPNAFLADPPLDDVVTRSFEFGVRGKVQDMTYQAGYFNATNHDDILFQTTGRSTGLFANVDKTRRRGVELALQGSFRQLDWYANWTYLQATFEDSFSVLSPNHPNADGAGKLAVSSGDRIPGLPEHLVKLGGDFHVSDNFSLGAELIYNSDQILRGDESNELPACKDYALFNLRASLLMGNNFSVYARITNVFDKDYDNFGLIGEDPTEILPDLSDNRPVFLGVGAPRAAWIGMRYKF